MVATLQRDPQVTHCQNCPNARHIEGNRYSCALDGKVTRGHWPATQDCYWAVEDEQAKAQSELEQHIEVQAETIAPEYELREVEELVVAVDINYQVAGYVYFSLVEREWYVNHTDRPFTNLREAADSVAIYYSRRQSITLTQGTVCQTLREVYGADICGEDVTGWEWDDWELVVTVSDTAESYRVTLEQIEAANKQTEYTAQEAADIEADLLRF